MDCIKVPDMTSPTYGRLTHSTYGVVRYYKQGDIVTVEILSNGISNSEWHTIGQLPEGCRPMYQMYYVSWVREGNTATIYIDTDGSVRVIGTTNPSTSVSFIAMSF